MTPAAIENRQSNIEKGRAPAVPEPRYDASAYDYELPPEFIPQEPVTPRDASRLAVLDRGRAELVHAAFRDLPRFLKPGDLLVLNDTRVIPARVHGSRTSGGRAEALFLRDMGKGRWEALLRSNGPLRPGEWLHFGGGSLRVRLLLPGERGLRLDDAELVTQAAFAARRSHRGGRRSCGNNSCRRLCVSNNGHTYRSCSGLFKLLRHGVQSEESGN